MAKLTKQCYKCKEQFRKEELVDYCTARAKTLHSYCPKCLREVQEYEWFSNEICKIFGVKMPGPQINTERKKLKETYGYTDQTIIDCLKYVYEVEKIKQEKVTLYFVNTTMMEKMMKYKRMQKNEGNSLAQAMHSNFTEYIVPIREAKPREPELLNPDDFLDD